MAVLAVAFAAGCPADDDGESYEIPDYEEGDDYDPNDLDYDTIPVDVDNCPDNYNLDQSDVDGDGIGDICDNCIDVPNVAQTDADFDGTGDPCDGCPYDPFKTTEGVCGCGTPDVDLNGDGVPDCDDLPEFTEIVIDTQVSHGQEIDLVDLDGDGNLDIVAALSDTDTIYAYMNNGGGQSWFKMTIAQPLSIVAMDVAIADIDGDGDLDIAAVELFDRFIGFESPGQVVWYEHPAGTFGTWTRHDVTDQTVWGARTIDAADLTGNGLPDLVVGCIKAEDSDGTEQGDGVYWFTNIDGGATWSEQITIDAVLEGVERVLTLDVDLDGTMDIVAAGFEDNDVMWYRNERTPGATDMNPAFTDFSMGLIPSPYDIAVVEGGFGYTDGRAIIVVDTGAGNALDLSYLVPLTSVTESWVSWTVTSDFPGGTLARACPVDFNSDGLNDVVVASNEEASIRVYLDDGANGWEYVTIVEGYTGLTDVKAGDINNDGRPDLVTTTYNADGGDRIAWWPNLP